MKTCVGCKNAAWKMSKNGNLHPSGDGRCLYEYKLAPLPVSMCWITLPKPNGGVINRRVNWPEHCVYWTRA